MVHTKSAWSELCGGEWSEKARAARPPSLATVYWLIENPGIEGSEVFTVRVDAEREALPIFSFPEEAEMFLQLGGLEDQGWRRAESTGGEIVSRLAEYRSAGVDLVALDPLPEMVGSMFDATIVLVTLSLRGFAERHAADPLVTAFDVPNPVG